MDILYPVYDHHDSSDGKATYRVPGTVQIQTQARGTLFEVEPRAATFACAPPTTMYPVPGTGTGEAQPTKRGAGELSSSVGWRPSPQNAGTRHLPYVRSGGCQRPGSTLDGFEACGVRLDAGPLWVKGRRSGRRLPLPCLATATILSGQPLARRPAVACLGQERFACSLSALSPPR